MTLQTAHDLINNNLHLIGTTRDKLEIEHLVIVPTSGDRMDEIIKQILWDQPCFHLLTGYNDFKVIALLDFSDYPNSGMLFYEDIERIIQ